MQGESSYTSEASGVAIRDRPTKLAHRHRLEPPRGQRLRKGANERDGPRAAGSRGPWSQTIVHQKDRAILETMFHAGEHRPRPVAAPVLAVRRPADEAQPKFRRHLFGIRRHEAPRNPPVPGLHAEAPEDVEAPAGIVPYLVDHKPVVAAVLRAVKGDLVPGPPRRSEQPSMEFGAGRHHEERRPRPDFFQSVQHTRRPDRIRPVVERQRDPTTHENIRVLRLPTPEASRGEAAASASRLPTDGGGATPPGPVSVIPFARVGRGVRARRARRAAAQGYVEFF